MTIAVTHARTHVVLHHVMMAMTAPELDTSLLSAAQLHHFHEFGYVVVRQLFTPAEVRAFPGCTWCFLLSPAGG